MKKAERLRKGNELFDRFSQELDSLGININGEVLCPLCLRSFPRNALVTKELTVEHFLPSALGGKDVTLTCEKCNRTHGSKLDSHLVSMVNAQDALEGFGALRTVVTVNGYKTFAEVTLSYDDKTPNTISVIEEASNPNEVQEQIKALRDGASEIECTMNLRYIPNRYRLGLLRVGYLALFQRLGYRYIFSGPVKRIREQLFNQDEVEPFVNWLLLEFTELGQRPRKETWTLLMKGFLSVPVYMVIIELKARVPQYKGVLMPPMDPDEGEVFYNELHARVEKVGAQPQHITMRFSPPRGR